MPASAERLWPMLHLSGERRQNITIDEHPGSAATRSAIDSVYSNMFQ